MTIGELAFFALGAVAGILGGIGLRGWWLARHSALLNDAIRDGVRHAYPTTKDGRNADNYAPGRYARE